MTAQRPLYHFQPAANWMNDPNGPILWQGQYHLFYQHNPNSPLGGPRSWGHAVSSDLVHWRHMPIALAPTPDSPDADGCWSGCAVDDDGIPTIVYTGVCRDRACESGYRQSQCIATSAGDLRSWQKSADNPVIAGPPASFDVGVTAFRDPYVWREAGVWYAVIGSGGKSFGGCILLYRSSNLRQWDYLGPLYTFVSGFTDLGGEGSVYECPQFFRLGDRHVLMFSVNGPHKLQGVVYMTGTYIAGRFAPHSAGRFDVGPDHYASATMGDATGRRLSWGWSWEARRRLFQRDAGWAGVMTLPRVLTLRSDGLLGVEPAPELAALRVSHFHVTGVALTCTSPNLLSAVRGECLEILVRLKLSPGTAIGLKVRRSPGDEEYTCVSYDDSTKRLSVDREHASEAPGHDKGVYAGVLPAGADGDTTLHVFLDRTIVEVYANGAICLTTRIYPAREDSTGLDLVVQQGEALVRALDVWELVPARPTGEQVDR